MKKSVLTKKQTKEWRKEMPNGDVIVAEVRYDDECGNGHNSFSITGMVYDRAERIPGEASTTGTKGRRWLGSCGCCHKEIAEAFPGLAPLIKWHGCTSEGPTHYIANTVYMAGDKDHNGLLKGERRQIVNGRTGKPHWSLEAVNAPGVSISKTPTGDGYRDAETVPLFILEDDHSGALADAPPVPVLRWVPCCTIGEGKARELDHARNAAVWPDATDEDLTAPGLETRLKKRLPALLKEFCAAVESLGFTY